MIPFFIKKKAEGVLPITHVSMTRFWITLEQGVEFVLHCLQQMHGGELFVPKIPSMNIMDLAKAIAPEAKIEIIGIRPGEKIHEVLISDDHAEYTYQNSDRYITFPDFINIQKFKKVYKNLKKVSVNFSYNSSNNSQWIPKNKIKNFIDISIKKNKI